MANREAQLKFCPSTQINLFISGLEEYLRQDSLRSIHVLAEAKLLFIIDDLFLLARASRSTIPKI